MLKPPHLLFVDAATLVVLFIGRGAIKQGGLAKMGKSFWKILKLSMGVCEEGLQLLIMMSCEYNNH